MPSTVVGTCTTCTPRSQVAATKPARSVTAPPPKPTTASVRVKSAWPITCQQNAATSTRLPASASGISASSTSRPPSDMSRSRSCAAAAPSVGGCTTSTLRTVGGERLADAIQDAAADDDVVAGVAGHGDRRGLAHACSSAFCVVLRPGDDLGDDAASGPDGGVERDVGDFFVRAATLGEDRLPAGDRVLAVQQRPVRTVDAAASRRAATPSGSTTRCAPRSARVAASSIAPPPRATTPPPVEGFGHRGALELPEARLAEAFEDLGDRTVIADDQLVGVDEAHAERPRDTTADARLARAHRSDQDDRTAGRVPRERGHAR